ncbi:MAG: hypothetical protein VB078_09685 [Clostridiaceae bacterium]|nr:hypothetical protein [Clostridiaceae bacterium]
MNKILSPQTLIRVTGEKLSAEILFFLICLDGQEYVAYTEDGGSIPKGARIRKSIFGWKIEELWPDHPVMEEIYDILDDHACDGSIVECRGETYMQRDGGEGLYYIKSISEKKAAKFLQRKKLAFSLCAAFAGLVIGAVYFAFSAGYLPNFEAEATPAYQEIKAALPDEADYIEYLSNYLNDDNWPMLTVEKKLEILQAVCDWESVNVLGCSDSTVKAEELPETNLGYYNKSGAEIVISVTELKECSWKEAVGTIIHETRHSWQRDMIELLDNIEKDESELANLNVFDEVKEYRDVWTDYTSGLIDFDKYYSQAIEEDSRNWSTYRIETYYIPNLVT